MIYWMVLVNYVAWYVFVFIAVTWMIVLFSNRGRFAEKSVNMPKTLPGVSVLIPAYNEGDSIRKTVNSVLAMDYPKNRLEVIVIDDASGDETGRIAHELEAEGRIKVIVNPKNRGKAYSLNRALKVAKYDIIACIDADSTVEPDILRKMIPPLLENGKVASVTPALKVLKPENLLEKIQHAEYILNIFLRKSLSVIDSIHVTPGVFSIYRKSVLEEIGGFDEKNLTEDMEIALSIQNAGYRIENRLDAISYTICPSKLRNLFDQRIRWYRGALQNTVKYRHMIFRKRYGNLGMFLLPFNFISILAVIIIFTIILWNFADNLLRGIWQMTLIDWNFMVLIDGFILDPKAMIFNMLTTSFVLMALGTVIGGYILLKSFRVSDERFSLNKLGYFTYLFIYPFFMMFFWMTAMVFELLRIRRKW
jgi:cellulose synthase/poly-beta-1,6-N-acetylglucosamine synthase-like glycosyltransferase